MIVKPRTRTVSEHNSQDNFKSKTMNTIKKLKNGHLPIGGVEDFDSDYKKSIENPEEFWGNLGKLVHWDRPFKRVMDNDSPPFTRWYCGGYLNACYNCIDRHILAGRGNKVALIHDSPLANIIRHVTYQELYDQVSLLAGGLQKLGVRKGDRVVIYMPLIPETIMAMLATARLGAVHSVVFGGNLNLIINLI